ncbi:MAG: type VII secretion protein EccCb [Actinocatenispora sp.]
MARRLAVLVANNRYWDEQLPDLHAPIDEARQLRDLLRDPEIGEFDPAELLINESKADVERKLEAVFRAAEPDDLVFLYFSGHGIRSRGGRLHLAVSNTQLDLLAATSVSSSFIKELIDESDTGSTVIALDCCYSGAFHGPEQLKSDPSFDVGPELVGTELLAGRGVYVLTASNSVQQADDGYPSPGGGTLSAFTEALVRGLATGDADVRSVGRISPSDLGEYVRREVPRRTSRQTPTQYGYVEDEVQLARVRDRNPSRQVDTARVHLGDLLGPVSATAERGARAEQWRGTGRLTVPVGQVRRPGVPGGEAMELDLAGVDGHLLIVGRPGSGKTTLLRTLLGALALTHGPDEAAFLVLESGGNRLGAMRKLPHFVQLAGDDEPDKVQEVLDNIAGTVRRRKRLFREHDVDAPGGFWTVRRDLPDGPHPDVFLVVDRWQDFASRSRSVEATVWELASGGLDYGVHVVLAGRRWGDFTPELCELVPCHVELRLSQPATSQVDPTLADQLPADRPGWGLRQRRRFRVALPNLASVPPVPTGEEPFDELSDGAGELVGRVVRAWPGGNQQGSAATGRWIPPLNTSMDVLELLGIDNLETLDLAAMWAARQPADFLRIPLGSTADGSRIALDLKESAQGGMGPHGLLVGATGSGKSELLRSMALSLALTHSPDELNLLLIGFKGAAKFAPLARLPHTSAVVTGLEDGPFVINRLAESLSGELLRRQELLRSAGNYTSRRDYQAAWRAGEPLEPLPALLVICDEFSEVLAAKPDFVDLFIQIGRIGRSLGVHLLLSSQRLEEGRLRGLDTHLSYRIALRTFSAAESRMVLGSADAYELPNAPGHGYLLSDPQIPVRFRAGTTFNARPVGEAGAVTRSVLELAGERLRGNGPPARPVWLPLLRAPQPLSRLYERLERDPRHGLRPVDRPDLPPLRVPVGLVDKPFEQRRELLVAELDGTAGSVAVVGGPQSGKSTMLRTLVCSLALSHSPREVQFFCLDLGGGALAALRELPHVCGVAGPRDDELLRRTVAEVTRLLDAREALFAEGRIDSMATYRRERYEGRHDGDPFGDVFVVVDGWRALRDGQEEHAQELTTLAGRGLAYGVHLIVTAGRWTDLRPALRDVLGTRYELRLGDPTESEIDRRLAAIMPIQDPGRGLSANRLHFLSALPRIDDQETTADLSDGVADLVGRVRAAWPAEPAPPVRLLPRQVSLGTLVGDRSTARPGQVVLGVGESRLSPVGLDFSREPHFLAVGDTECGKSALLRLVAGQLAATHEPHEARILLVDYRRSLLGAVDDEHLLANVASGPRLERLVPEVVEVLKGRLPGPDVSVEQLRSRSWWTGPDLYVIVDDYDLVAGPSGNPVAPLVEFLPQARDIGLHLVLARRCGGISRALYEPVIQRITELAGPTLLMSGDPAEGRVFGNLRASPLPPGRGTLTRRREGAELVQVAWPNEVSPDVAVEPGGAAV